MDVSTYQLALAEGKRSSSVDYKGISDRVGIIESMMSNASTTIKDTFDDVSLIDKLKTTARIERGVIRMPQCGSKVVAYDFNDFYDVNFKESSNIDINRSTVVLDETSEEGFLVTKWQDIPLSTEINASVIKGIATRTDVTLDEVVQGKFVYLYSDNSDEYLYKIYIDCIKNQPNKYTPEFKVECINKKGTIEFVKKFYPFECLEKDSVEFTPVSGLTINRSFNGDLLFGLTVRNTRAIYGYGDRGSTNYFGSLHENSNVSSSTDYYESINFDKKSDSDSMWDLIKLFEGNIGCHCTFRMTSKGSFQDIKIEKYTPYDIYCNYEGYSRNRKINLGPIGFEATSLPIFVESNRGDVINSCINYPNANYGAFGSCGVVFEPMYDSTVAAQSYSVKKYLVSDSVSEDYTDSNFIPRNIVDDKYIYKNYLFKHDNVIYSLLIKNDEDTVNYKTLLKNNAGCSSFDKNFVISNKMSTSNKTINDTVYLNGIKKLLVISGKIQNDTNNEFTFEFHDVDPNSRTIANKDDFRNTKTTLDFEDKFKITTSTHFAKYGHTGSYFCVHEDISSGLLHIVFPGRRVGENTSICRLYHLTLDLTTLVVVGSIGEVAMIKTEQNDMYNFQNVSMCTFNDDLYISYLFSDGRDHSDTKVVKVKVHKANLECRLQTNAGHNIKFNSDTQEFLFDEPISKVRFVCYMDNRIGIAHRVDTFIDHIEFTHNGSISNNDIFIFESELLPLSMNDGRVRFDVDYDKKDGDLNFYISFDYGASWISYTPGTYQRFKSSKYNKVKFKIEFTKGDSVYDEFFMPPFVNAYFMQVDGNVLQNDVTNLQLSLMKTNFKIDSFTNASRNRIDRMIIDVFNDESNINGPKSKYNFDSKLKMVNGEYFFTKEENTIIDVNNILITSDEVVGVNDSIDYYVSKDGGLNFTKVHPGMITSIPTQSNCANKLVVKVEFNGSASLSALAWAWN